MYKFNMRKIVIFILCISLIFIYYYKVIHIKINTIYLPEIEWYDLSENSNEAIEHKNEVTNLYDSSQGMRVIYNSINISKLDDIVFLDYYEIIDGQLYLWFKGNYLNRLVYFKRTLREGETPTYSAQSTRAKIDKIKLKTDSGIFELDGHDEVSKKIISPLFTEIGYYTFHIFTDEENWYFINKHTDKSTFLRGDLVLSNQDNRFITVNSKPNLGENSIDVYQVDDKGITNVISIVSEMDWLVINYKWLSSDVFEFDVIYSYDTDDQSAERKRYQLKYYDLHWHIENGDERLIIKETILEENN